MKQYEVAVGNGIALKVKVVNEQEYNKLMLENQKELERRNEEIADLNRHIDNLEFLVHSLEKEIRKLKGEE